MLGVLGFSFAAMAVSAFAYTVEWAYPGVPAHRRTAFSTAFWLLAMDMLLWALVAAFANHPATPALMLASDALLALATGYMAYVLLADDWHVWYVLPIATLGAIMLGLRATVFMPETYVQSGLLHFNLQPSVRNAILGVLVAVWLPAVLEVARQIGDSLGVQGLQQGLEA